MAKLLLGKEVTDALNANLQTRTAALREKGVVPTLGIIRVGANPSDLSYEKGAVKRYLHPMALMASAKLRLIRAARLDAQRLLHRFLRIISLHLILVGIIGYKLLALRSRNLIMQYVGGIAPSR